MYMEDNRVNLWRHFYIKYFTDIEGSYVCISVLKAVFVIEWLVLGIESSSRENLNFWVEKNLICDLSDLIPIAAIAWGAAAIPISFLLGRIEQRNYGIRLADLLAAGWGTKRVFFLICSFCLQLFFLTVSVINNMKVSFIVVVFTHLLYVFFAFYIVVLSMFRKVIQNIIRRQSECISLNSQKQSNEIYNRLLGKKISEQNEILIECGKIIETQHWLLTDMIENLDYYKLNEYESFMDILKNSVYPNLKGIVGRKTAYDLFRVMMSVAQPDIVYKIIKDSFRQNIGIDAKKGILCALISERKSEYYSLCESIMETLIDNDTNIELLCWTILWSMNSRIFNMNSAEIKQNDGFIFRMQVLLEQRYGGLNNYRRKQFNDLIWQSCQDIILLEKVYEFDMVLVCLFEDRLEFLLKRGCG